MKPKLSIKLKITLMLFRRIPLAGRRAVFTGLARLVYHLSLKHRLITIHNLTRSFPEKSPEDIVEIAKASYGSFALFMAELPDLYSLNDHNIDQWVKVKGLDHYEKALRKGKGVLLISGHFGNWEFGCFALAILSEPPVFMGRRMDSNFVEEVITYPRKLLGIETLNKENAMRPALRLLKSGKAIKLLIDQNVSALEGVFIDFFGRPACTTSGVALMAMRTGAAVLPIFTTRMPDGSYLTEIGEEIATVETGDRQTDIVANTQNYASVIENQIRKYPKQWLWLHQRWKTKLCQVPPNRKQNDA